MRKGLFSARAPITVACLLGAAVPILAGGPSAAAAARPADAPSGVPEFDHIVVVTMENKSYDDIIGNAQAPYLNSLAQQYGVASQYFAIRHPSLPNYLALTGGDTFGVTTDCNTCYLSQPNIAVDRIETAGRTWKAYMESMPAACTLGDTGQYIQHHNPFVYYDDIRTNPNECANDVPYTQLAGDFAATATTPDYAWISPNICNDMHNCSIATGDAWLQQNVEAILATPAFTTQNSLLVITFDEDDSSSNNQVPTFLIGPGVTPGLHSTVSSTHYSLLKTIEAAWNLAPLAAGDAAAAPMTEFFAPASMVAADSFGRSVAGGWGTADAGGAWSVAGTPSAFAVNGSTGTVSLARAAGQSARLLDTSTSDVDLHATLSFDRQANGGGQYAALIARHVSGGNEYRIRMHVTSSGNIALSFSRFVHGSETLITGDTTVPGLHFAPDTQYDLHATLTGTSPTNVQARIWPDSTTEPSTWNLTTTDTTTALQAPGAIGIWGFLTATASNGPSTLTVDNLTAASTATPPPPPPPPPPGLARDSFGRSVAGGWGTADAGGAWSVAGTPSAFAVNGSTGTVSLVRAAGQSARLLDTSTSDVDLHATLSFDRQANGGGQYAALIARHVSGGNEYRIRMHVTSSGNIALSFSRFVHGSETLITGDTTVPGLHFTPDTQYDLHATLTGTSPTNVQARIWPDSTTEPSTWNLTTTDTTTALQAPGAIGIWGFLTATASNGPSTLTVDNLTAS